MKDYLDLFTENLALFSLMCMLIIPVVVLCSVVLFELYMQISGKRVDNSHIDKKEVKGFDDFLCEITDPVTKFFETLGKNFLWLLLIALCIALVTIIGIGVFMIHPLLGIILLLITGIYVLMMILK